MPSKTNTDLIRELGQRVASLETQVGVLRESNRDIYKLFREAEFRLVRLEEKTGSAEADRRERSSRSSFLWIAIVSAVVGAIVGPLSTFVLQRFLP